MRSLVEFVIIFITTETPNTINSRTLVLASYGGGKLTVKCPSPETLRQFPRQCLTGSARQWTQQHHFWRLVKYLP